MTVKSLLARIVAAIAAFIAVTAVYEIVMYVVLRPLTNELVENQLAASNAAPAGVSLYFTLANGLLALACLALAAFCVASVVKYVKERK